MEPIIIIGTGIAGYTLARELRKRDQQTPLLLISADDGSNYPKPMLSNALSKGKTAKHIALADSTAMAATLAAEIIVNTEVTQIDPITHTVTLDNNSKRIYKKLVLTVGAQPISPPLVGDALAEVITINSLADYTIFRQRLLTANHVTLIGPGLIGCEFANDLVAASETKVSVVGPSPLPMSNLLPKRIASELKDTLAAAGIDWRLGVTADSIQHQQQGYQLTLSNGEIINTDLVISAIGLTANRQLAMQAGLATNKGIITDHTLQTSDKDIYALGDCAEVAGHHLLYIAPIMLAAKALAKTLTGEPSKVHYPAMPVTVKTPLYPLVIAPPVASASGQWQFEQAQSGMGIKGLFTNNNGDLLGFVLTGDITQQKMGLAKQLPDLL